MKSARIFYLNFAVFLLALAFSGWGGFLFTRDIAPSLAAEEEKIDPPKIFNVQVGDVSATSTLITWETDKPSDALINFGLSRDYGIVRNPDNSQTKHQLLLESLMPGMEYFFRITSSDPDGNQGISSDYSFMTPKKELYDKTDIQPPKQEEIVKEGKGGLYETVKEESEIVQQAVKMIESLKSEESIQEVEQAIQKQAEEEVKPPTIILDYADLEVGTDYAIIRWETDKESNSVVALATEEDFRAGAEDPYRWREGHSEESVTKHEVIVNGLRPSTTYHFQVSSKDSLDLYGRSIDKTFKTKSIKPEIANIQISKIEEDSATIRYTTNVPCASVLDYTNLNNNQTKIEGNNNYLTVHNVRLSNLVFDTYYSVVIRVESEEGEKSESDPVTFITVRDKIAPTVSKVSTESTMYPGSDNKIQTIVSWRTDEPAKCLLSYSQGVSTQDEPESLPIEEEFGVKHVQVVTNFQPGAVYKFWLDCADDTGNKGRSDDFTMLTPSQEESIIDIIIKNFESSFGWIKPKK